ncbi:hypothetical protein DK26_10705 [Bosea sp. WAO]|uniref:WGR domain-containing protein n=1 Tax=Bosea sp. WAO TaxID=406341 RepID=UPI00074A5D04|nr:WGR domain-containing protein [Bosea sp. WAO]KUL95575.1 hypothetical protein DK26_10705 [Bosea sp. WAO]
MIKLYRSSGPTIHYWETWAEDDRRHIVHWGELGTRGTSKIVKSTFLRKARHIVQKEIDERLQQGYQPIPDENHAILMIEYAVAGFGTSADLDKRHRLEQRMNETLGWTGLGTCDGGSIGSGSMEVCNSVVDFDLAKRMIERDLADTEFSDFVRIYDERAG